MAAIFISKPLLDIPVQKSPRHWWELPNYRRKRHTVSRGMLEIFRPHQEIGLGPRIRIRSLAYYVPVLGITLVGRARSNRPAIE